MKRRRKPKVLLLSTKSRRSVARLAAALAYTNGGETPPDYKLRRRAQDMLELLEEMS